FPDHPLGRDITGTEATVSGISRDDLEAYLRGHYLSRNLVVGVTGAIDEARVRTLVEGALQLPNGPDADHAEAAPPALTRPELRLHRKQTEQAHICLGTRAMSYLDPDRYAIDLVNTMLGEGMSS